MERVIFLRSTELGLGLPDPALRALAEVAMERRINPGQVLCYEGELGSEMFLIIQGTVNVHKLGSKPPRGARADQLGTFQASMHEGQLVGLWAVLDDQPRSASLVTTVPVDILILQKEDLRDAIALCPDLAFGLFRVLTRSLRNATAAPAVHVSGTTGNATPLPGSFIVPRPAVAR